jgi:hypothetical protein
MAHIPYEELSERLAKAASLVEVGARYRHYRTKGTYTVLSLALQEETERPCVVYQTSHASRLTWVRNLDDWLAPVISDDGKTVPRFERILEDR